MKKLCGALFVAFLVAVSGTSHAVGLGASLEVSGGSGELNFDDPLLDDTNVDTGAVGLNFVLDTSPLRGPLSYRLNVGFESMAMTTSSEQSGDEVTFQLGGIVLDNTLAFSVLQSERVKLWLGPQLRLAAYSGETDEDVLGEKIEVDFTGVGIGLGFGGNFAVGRNMCLAGTLGYRYTSYSGETDWLGETNDMSGNSSVVFLNFAFMFLPGN